ncbi:MAG: hypothetical protein CSA49_04155 [Gammaproteobacteria bacterium]|nr:MAG: hypothetical protein CSA49_04155 [Gammaproteobacteria bacterium]
MLGAPVPGQADQWAPRLAKGTDAVYANALNGLNAMPPKGGCGGCSDEEIKATVDFMIEQSK